MRSAGKAGGAIYCLPYSYAPHCVYIHAVLSSKTQAKGPREVDLQMSKRSIMHDERRAKIDKLFLRRGEPSIIRNCVLSGTGYDVERSRRIPDAPQKLFYTAIERFSVQTTFSMSSVSAFSCSPPAPRHCSLSLAHCC